MINKIFKTTNGKIRVIEPAGQEKCWCRLLLGSYGQYAIGDEFLLSEKQIQKFELKPLELTGGFSKGVTETEKFERYAASNCPSGYIGAGNRSVNKDKIVEKALRETGLGDKGVATWLTSSDGRHLMDDVGHTIEDFEKRVKIYTKNAFLKITIWSNPDHKGTLASTKEIERKILKAIKRNFGRIGLCINGLSSADGEPDKE